jgi:hypothetical protein
VLVIAEQGVADKRFAGGAGVPVLCDSRRRS